MESEWVKMVLVIVVDGNYEGVSRSFQTGRLERELKMAQLSAPRYSCISIM
jgi:hypothetical protein